MGKLDVGKTGFDASNLFFFPFLFIVDCRYTEVYYLFWLCLFSDDVLYIHTSFWHWGSAPAAALCVPVANYEIWEDGCLELGDT